MTLRSNRSQAQDLARIYSRLTAAAIAAFLLCSPIEAADEAGRNATDMLLDSVPPDLLFYGETEFQNHLETEAPITNEVLIIPAADFVGDGGTRNTFLPFNHGYIEGAELDCMAAPVQLPQGTEITGLFGFLYDESGADIYVELRRAYHYDTDAELMAGFTSVGSSSNLQIPGDITIANGTVDNAAYSYFVTTCVYSTEHRFNALWLFYDPPVNPQQASSLNVFSGSGDTQVLVEENNATVARRQLFRLENNGAPEFSLVDNDLGLTWKFGTRGNHFEINRGNSGQTEMLLRANGDLEIVGTLSQGSSRTLKQDFEAVDNRDILDRVAELPLLEWSYKTAEDERHFGPMAEDFHAAFGLGHDPARLAPGDAAGVALAAIQGLSELVEERDREIAKLHTRLEQLERRMDEDGE